MPPEITIRATTEADLSHLIEIWNEVVEEGRAFPQEDFLSLEDAAEFFADQTYVGVAVVDDRVQGLYILHPNNVGRCSHIANASFAVSKEMRGNGIGHALVSDCLEQTAKRGFKGLQFNAVVKSNEGAIALYEKLAFERIGIIPNGFRNKFGEFEDIIIFYHEV